MKKIGKAILALITASAAPLINAQASTNSLAGEPTIALTRQGSEIILNFSGVLQSANTVTGPWTDAPGVNSPYIPPVETKKFFRTRGQSVFSGDSVIAMIFTAPFQTNFELAKAGIPDGIIPPIREKPYFDGMMQFDGKTLSVSLRVRGNSSLQECPFPKLKFKVNKENRAGTVFADAREIKIGTHCAEGGHGPIGRLREEIATYREGVAYEVMNLLGFVSPRVRRAEITYRDSSPTNGINEARWEVTRMAVILDDGEVVAERLGGRALDDEEISALVKADFGEQLITDLRLLHVLLGNWDFALSADGKGLWNTDVIEMADKRLVPMAGDFDLASFVTGIVRLNAPGDYYPELTELERETRYQLEQVIGRVGAELFAASKARFMNKKSAIEAQIQAASIDEPGRINALHHVTAFYSALETLGGKGGSR